MVKSDIGKTDTVYEIGAGEGIITGELLKKAGKVIAYELDEDFFGRLKQEFRNNNRLELKPGNFLDCKLPEGPYKVFSNIPFNITAAIVKKFVFADNPPHVAYLIIQKEAAAKFAGKPVAARNSQLTVILYPWFEFCVVHNFKPDDFYPVPKIGIVLLKIKTRAEPIIAHGDRDKYQDFVTYVFNGFKPKAVKVSTPSELDFKDWIDYFRLFLNTSSQNQDRVRDSFAKQARYQERLEKISRTRVDRNWRNFRKVLPS